MTRRLSFILLWALSCVSAFSLTSVERDSISRQFVLEEVVVASHRTQATPLSMQRLEGARLQELSVHTVADALRQFSGVQIKDYGGVGGLKTVDIRSMGSNHLGVMYDGIEVGNAQNGTVDLGKFSMDNIESLTLYNGQNGEIFQPAKNFGSASTLYIRTRRPRFEDNQRFHMAVTMKAGAFGLANPSLLYEQRLTSHLHLSVNAEYTYATGMYHFQVHQYAPNGAIAWDTTGIRQNGEIQAFRAEAGVFGYLPQGQYHVRGYYYQSERGIPRAIIRNQWTSDQRQWDRNAFVQGHFENQWQCYSLQVNAKYSNDYMRYLNPDTNSVYIDNTFLQQEVYLSLANQWKIFHWWDMVLSGDYIYNTLEANLYGFTQPHRHTGLVAVATSFHYRWISAQVSVLGTFVQDGAKEASTTENKQETNVSPAVYISYQPLLHEQWVIRAFYKQTYRMPTFNELYYTEGGVSRLRPEEAQQYDLGMEYTKKWNIYCVQGKVDAYFNQVKNKIVAIPKGNTQYRWQMMNIGYAEILGVDVNAGMDIAIPLSNTPTHPLTIGINGTYTYQHAQDLTHPEDELTYGGQIAYIPYHSASAMARIAWNGLQLSYTYNYVGTRFTSSANIRPNLVPAWDTHAITAGYHWDTKSGIWKITAEINNIANKQYEIIKNYPMPGLNGRLIIQYQITH